jgi:hypothetical protein
MGHSTFVATLTAAAAVITHHMPVAPSLFPTPVNASTLTEMGWTGHGRVYINLRKEGTQREKSRVTRRDKNGLPNLKVETSPSPNSAKRRRLETGATERALSRTATQIIW